MDLSERVSKIEAVLPTLATREDVLLTKIELTQQMGELRGEMHKEFNLQTWRIIGAIIAASGLLVAGLKLIP